MAAGAWLAPIRSSGVLELDRYSLFLRGGHAPAAPFSSGRLSRALYSFTATRRRSRAGFGRGIRQCLGDVGTHVSEMPSIISRSMVRMPRSPPNRRLDRSLSLSLEQSCISVRPQQGRQPILVVKVGMA